jgi:regulator of nonsense transcripts 1
MPNDPKDDEEKDDNNSEEGSIKSTDSKLGLQFLKYDSDEENSPPIQSQTDELEQKEESNIEEKEQTIPTQAKDENSDEEDENKNHNNLHCAYCGLSSEAHLAQCLECKKWFCNGKLDNFSPSHIIFHLTKSKHKEVYLSPSSQVGEITLQCYNCSCKNIFLLGFLESKEGGSGFIVCREPCLTKFKIDDSYFDKTKWAPLISEKKLLNWIVKEPKSDSELRIIQRVNIRKMSKFEEKWEKEKLLSSQEKPKFLTNFLKSVKLCYKDGQDYLGIFEPLISAEEEYDRKLKETQKKMDINIKFVKGGKKVVAKFKYPREDNEIKLVPGDELKITSPNSTMAYKGLVTEIGLDDEISMELEQHKPGNNSKKNTSNYDPSSLNNGKYNIEFVWKGTSFKRMLDGLFAFVNDENSVSPYIYSKILGHNVEEKKFKFSISKELNVKGLPKLNHSQKEGIEKAINTPLFLIQGPPGTGKTVTSAAIVYHLANLNVGKVLVCAPSNIAADQLSEKIEKIGLKVVRVCAKSRESISTRVEHLSLHNQLRRLDGKKEYKKFFEMLKRKEEEGNVLSNKDHEKYKKLKKKAEEEIINSCQVVVTTCISSFDKRLNNFRFPIVLIDEATQACESECILPLLHGAEHAIIVGDHCQLGPVVLCKNAAKAGLKMSLFERLVKLKIKPHMLQVQYRMHPKLSEFPSNTFYDGNLQNGVTSDDRIYFNVNFPWPNPKKPTFFYHIVGKEEFSASGTSYINREEADFIDTIVKTLLKCTVKPEQIGIITPYEGQRCYIVSRMLKNCASTEIEVSSVDSFQGREKDYIIMSCVRSNNHHGIGFLDDPRRLNVSLTRARYGLILVGNVLALSNHQLWINLLDHYQKMNLLVSGQLGSLKEVSVPLPPPKRYIPEKMVFENTEQLVKEPSNNQNGINDISITYTIDNHSYYSGYNSSVTDNTNKNEISNIATKSRFSDFGYINDGEAVSHYNKVKNVLMKKPLQFNTSFNKTLYDDLLMKYQNFNFMNRANNMNTYINPLASNMIMPGNPNMNLNMNMNMNFMMYQNMLGIYDPKIWGGSGNKSYYKDCYNNFTKAQNGWKHNEKKFVLECDF